MKSSWYLRSSDPCRHYTDSCTAYNLHTNMHANSARSGMQQAVLHRKALFCMLHNTQRKCTYTMWKLDIVKQHISHLSLRHELSRAELGGQCCIWPPPPRLPYSINQLHSSIAHLLLACLTIHRQAAPGSERFAAQQLLCNLAVLMCSTNRWQ